MRFFVEPIPILSIKWNFVRGWCPPFFRTVLHTTVQYILQFCCTCAVNKTSGGPRAQEGTRTTGNTRALTHGHLKAVH